MKASEAAQRRLLDLTGVDTQIMQLAHRRRNLPEHAAVLRLQKELATIDDRLTAAETTVSDLGLEQRRLEQELEPVRQRKERNEQRIAEGTEAAKTLQGLMEEVTSLERRIRTLEDEELEIMEQMEQASAARDEVAARHDGMDAELQSAIEKRTQVAQQIDAAAKGKIAQRTEIARELPKDLFDTYEKIRKQTGAGAAALVARRCQGCGLEANQADLRRYAEAAPDEVLRCAECRRILIRTKESGI